MNEATEFGKRVGRSGVLAALLAFALTGCKPPSSSGDLGVRLTLSPSPPRVGAADLTLKLSERGQPLSGAAVSVEGNMTHAGMYPVRARALPRGGGDYRVPKFMLSMAGDWVLTVRAEKDGRVLSADVPLEVLSSEGGGE